MLLQAVTDLCLNRTKVALMSCLLLLALTVTMGGMSREDRQRVADLVRARRGKLDLSQEELAAKAGVSLRTVTNIESGRTWPIATNRSKLEGALGWADGDLVRIGRGGEPSVAAAEAEEPTREQVDVLSDLPSDPAERMGELRRRLDELTAEAQKLLGGDSERRRTG